MIKRLMAIFLTIAIILSMSSVVFAADTSDITLNYLLTYNGKHTGTVPTGTEITVEYAVKNITNESDFSVYTIQNEIYYDHNFFEFVDNSFDMEFSSLQTSVKNSEGENHKLIKEIYINDSTTQQYQNHQVVGTFKLKVIATSGSSTIKSTEIITYKDGSTKYGVSNQIGNLTITVGDGTVEPTMFAINYVSNGVTITQQAADGEVITFVTPENIPQGKLFDYWQDAAGTKYNAGDTYKVQSDKTFTAVFKDMQKPKEKYTLTFNTNGGDELISVTADEGTVIYLSIYNPKRNGYTFEGWYKEVELKNKITSVTLEENTTVHAKWKRTFIDQGGTAQNYTLTFETNNGTGSYKIPVLHGTIIDLSKYVPTKEGYIFKGWHLDKELTNPIAEISIFADTTVYAKWEKENVDTPYVKPDYKPGILTNEHYAYIVGREGGMIEPESDITRAEVATIIYRLLNEDERNKAKTKENIFIDVNENDWFNTAVSTLASLGLINGRTTDTFAPNAFITRAEVATIFARMVEIMYDGRVLFSDISGHWAQNYINETATAEWIVGFNGLFRPDDNITRAEVMTLVNRVLNREPENINDLLDGMTTWKDNSNENAWYYVAVQEATNSHTYEMKVDGKHEKWVALLENPDWSKLEE